MDEEDTEMPKVSVVVPIFNTEGYLPACLNSLLAQTVKDIEIIAVNNGSTDGSGDILKAYARRDSRIRIVSKPHGDIYTARNAGLKAALGEWIAFCDSDDTLPPQAYERMLRKARRTRCDVVVGGYIELDVKGTKMPATLPRKRADDFGTLMRTPCVWNKIIRRGFLLEHGLKFPPVPIEDVIFLARLLRCAPRIERVCRPVYYYWQHSSGNNVSLSYRYTADIFNGLIRSHRMVWEELRETMYRSDVEEYVFCVLSGSLKGFLSRIWDCSEREACFELFRDHILSFDWTGREERFMQLFEVPLPVFRVISAQSYIKQIIALDHRRAVLVEYRVGTIGFQYIFAYTKAWFGYKLRRFRRKDQAKER